MRRLLASAAGVVLATIAVAAYSGTRPDPAAQAVADGCERNINALYTHSAPNWVYVNDKDYPADGPTPSPQWAKGIADALVHPFLAAHPAGGDNPFTHGRHDFLTNVRVDPQYAFLLGGDEVARTGNFEVRGEGTARLHTEWEEVAWPTFAWPERGDRVELLGSWVWDCDHFAPSGEHTELHPLRAVWVRRANSARSPYGEAQADLVVSTDKTHAGAQADCAHRAKGDDAAFRACLASDAGRQKVNGAYGFTFRAPPRPSAGARLHVRIVDRGSVAAPPVRVRTSGTSVAVTTTIDAPPEQRVVVAKSFFAGWRPMPARRLPEHLRVSFRELLVRRAMDPGCPASNRSCSNPESTLGDQNSEPPGEWNAYWDAAGIWSRWAPALLRARDGQRFLGRQTVDIYIPLHSRWRLYAFARECDFGVSVLGDVPMEPCPRLGEFGAGEGDESAGHIEVRFRSPRASLGRHRANATVEASTCPPVNRHGCYRLTFDVRRIEDAARRAAATRR